MDQILQIVRSQKFEQILKNEVDYMRLISTLSDQFEKEGLDHHHVLLNKFRENLQLSMLQLFSELEDLSFVGIINVIRGLLRIIKQLQDQVTASKIVIREAPPKANKKSDLCWECSAEKDKKQIERIKKKLMVTELVPTDKQKNELAQRDSEIDEYLLSQQSHINDISFVLGQKNDFLSKFANQSSAVQGFLANQIEALMPVNSDLSDEIVKINESKNSFQQIQKNFDSVQLNLNEGFRLTMKDLIYEIVRRVQKKNYKKNHRPVASAYTQTIDYSDIAKIKHLEEEIDRFKRDVHLIKTNKQQSQKELIRYIDEQNEMKKVILKHKHEKLKLEEELRLLEEKAKSMEERLNNQIKRKNSELGVIEKIRKEEKTKHRESQKLLKNEIIGLKKQVPNKRDSDSTTIRESKQASQLIQSTGARQSVDFDFTEEQQKMEMQFIRKKNNANRSISTNSRNSRSSRINLRKQPEQQNLDLQKPQRSQIIEQEEEEARRSNKQSNLSIRNTISIILNNITEEQRKTVPEQQINLPETIFRMVRKRSNIRLKKFVEREGSNDENTLHSFINKTQRPNNFVEKSLLIEKCESFKPKGLQQIKRLRTEAEERSRIGTRKNILLPSRSMERLKSNVVQVRNLKSRKLLEDCQQEQRKLELIQIQHEHLFLFGGEKSAIEYENNTGIWPHLATADKLIVDFENTNFSLQIQKYFKYLEEFNNSKYIEYVNFLSRPATFLSAKKQGDKMVLFQMDKNHIKNLFSRLIRFHRICHRGCSHLLNFLEMIGFQYF